MFFQVLVSLFQCVSVFVSRFPYFLASSLPVCWSVVYSLDSKQANQLVYTCGKLSAQINDQIQSELFPNRCIWFEARIEHGVRYKNGIRWESIAQHRAFLDRCYLQDYNQQLSFKLQYLTSFGGTVDSRKQRLKNLSKYKEFYQKYALDSLNEKFYLGKHWLRLHQEYIQVDSNLYIQGELKVHDSGELEIVGTEDFPILVSTKKITLLSTIKSLSFSLFLFLAANIIGYSVIKENMNLFKAFNYTIPY